MRIEQLNANGPASKLSKNYIKIFESHIVLLEHIYTLYSRIFVVTS
jgi:hypothetical protein